MHILVFAVGIILFIGLVLVHEWGHYIVAKRNGVKAEEFGLGFPPRAWGRKLKSGMVLSLNWLPLGGFVKLKGENDSDERKGSLGAASLWSKAKIMLAGVTMNLLAGVAILTVLALMGMPKLLTQDSIGEDQFTVNSDTHIVHQQILTGPILDDSPAKKAGLKSTDTILSISNGAQNYQIKTSKQLQDATLALAGKEVTITIQRDKNEFKTQTKLLDFNDLLNGFRRDAGLKQSEIPTSISYKDFHKTINSERSFVAGAQDVAGVNAELTYKTAGGLDRIETVNFTPRAYLGIEPTQVQIQRSTWSAPITAIGLTGQIFKLTFLGLGHALGGLGSTIAGGVTGNHQARENGQDQASNQVGGPVAISVALWDYGSLGLNFMLFLIALISLTLALMNVLPIPALDGGRLAMMLISRGIFRRPLTRAMEERIVGVSFALLMALIVLITFVDVKRFF
jgi:regulator of sigma E protease